MLRSSREGQLEVTTSIAASLLAVICIVRFFCVGAQGLWLDELYTFSLLTGFDPYLFPGSDLTAETTIKTSGFYLDRMAEGEFFKNFFRNITHEGHPPVYYLLLKFWTEMFGYTEEALRSFSVATFFLTLPLVFSIARSVAGRASAIYATALFAALPVQMTYSLEARGYSLATLFVALATVFLFKIYSRHHRAPLPLIGWIFAATMAFMTHYYSLIFLSGLAAFFITKSFAEERRSLLSTRSGLLLTPYMFFLCWVPTLVNQTKAHGDSHWTQGAHSLAGELLSVFSSVSELVVGSHVLTERWTLWLLGLGILLAVCMAAVRAVRAGRTLESALCFSVFFCLFGVLFLDFLLDKKTASVSRYIIFVSIPLTIIFARIAWVDLRSRLMSLGVLATLCSISFQVGSGALAPKQMVKESVQYVEENKQDRAVTLISPSGPLLIGMSIYAEGDSLVAGVGPSNIDDRVEALLLSGHTEVWVIEQRLGLKSEPWAFLRKRSPVETKRFVGVDVKTYRP